MAPVAFKLSRTCAPRSDSRRKSKSEPRGVAASCCCHGTTSWFKDRNVCFSDRHTASRVTSGKDADLPSLVEIPRSFCFVTAFILASSLQRQPLAGLRIENLEMLDRNERL